MITEEKLKGNFYSAYFIDQDNKNIEVLFTEQDKMIVSVVPYDEQDDQFKALSKFINVDQIHENTYNKRKEDRKVFERQVMRIAERDGIFVNKEIDSKMMPLIVKTIFEDNNTDNLFAFKLALFELEQVRNSEDQDIKKKLRSANTKVEALQAVFELIK